VKRPGRERKVARASTTDGIANRSRRERKYLPDAEGCSERTTGIFATPPSGGRSRYGFDPDAAVAHISRRDKRMARLMEKVGPFRLELDELLTPFEALAESIVYQQLTGKAAATIFSRVKALYGGTRLPEAEAILKTPDERLRSVGLSSAKALALKDLADRHHRGLIPSLDELERMPDQEIIERLTAVRGIGQWTAEMLLIFRLARPDVLPVNDYGVRKGFAATFSRRELPTPKELFLHGERWRPYRSVASWYLWRALELPENSRKAKP